MKGRGVRVIDAVSLQDATPDAGAKDRFVLIDCEGLLDHGDFSDTAPLEKQRGVSFEKLLNAVAGGSLDPGILSSLAGRLARIDRRIGQPDRDELAGLAAGVPLGNIAAGLVHALDVDNQIETARTSAGLGPETEPAPEQVAAAAKAMLAAAAAPLAASPALRTRLTEVLKSLEQTIDHVSKDAILDARFAPEIKQRIAEQLVQNFEAFVAEHRDEITALQVLYSRPHRARLTHDQVKELADTIAAPPRRWTPQLLWGAYEELRKDKVRGASAQRLMTDLVSLVRFALQQDDELVPYGDLVHDRFDAWLLQQQNQGRSFTDEQRQWLEAMRDHVTANAEVSIDDLGYAPFSQMGGVGKAFKVFGGDTLGRLIEELNEVLAA
jgi:type I restriction enzyme R subunit